MTNAKQLKKKKTSSQIMNKEKNKYPKFNWLLTLDRSIQNGMENTCLSYLFKPGKVVFKHNIQSIYKNQFKMINSPD